MSSDITLHIYHAEEKSKAYQHTLWVWQGVSVKLKQAVIDKADRQSDEKKEKEKKGAGSPVPDCTKSYICIW